MEFDIKYSLKDYLAALKFKLSYLMAEIKSDGKYFSYAVMVIIAPFVISGVAVYAFFTKLHFLSESKPDYKFLFDENEMTRTHDKQTGKLEWNRLQNFRESPQLFLIEFTNKGDDLPSHVLIPKRFLKDVSSTAFKNLLIENKVVQS